MPNLLISYIGGKNLRVIETSLQGNLHTTNCSYIGGKNLRVIETGYIPVPAPVLILLVTLAVRA